MSNTTTALHNAHCELMFNFVWDEFETMAELQFELDHGVIEQADFDAEEALCHPLTTGKRPTLLAQAAHERAL